MTAGVRWAHACTTARRVKEGKSHRNVKLKNVSLKLQEIFN